MIEERLIIKSNGGKAMKNILLLYDSKLAKKNIKDSISSLEIEVLEIRVSYTTVKKIFSKSDSSTNFDLIILEIASNFKDKINLLRHLQEKVPKLPIVVLNSDNSKSTILKMNRLGADEYILKPFDQKVLYDKVKYCLKSDYKKEKKKKNEEDFNYFKVNLLEEINRSFRSELSFSLVKLRVVVNADKLIDKELFLELLRSIDQVYLVSDKYFILLLPLTDQEGAEVVCSRIKEFLTNDFDLKSRLEISNLITFPELIREQIDQEKAVYYQNQIIDLMK